MQFKYLSDEIHTFRHYGMEQTGTKNWHLDYDLVQLLLMLAFLNEQVLKQTCP